ncbi:hypothetical protein CT113_12530 [Levilactobacillus brevis]|nr:hypothetical protein CT113_12530 [Levilactobacillus brevis]
MMQKLLMNESMLVLSDFQTRVIRLMWFLIITPRLSIFLMYVAHPKKRSRSIPLHTVETDDLVYLESLIKQIQAHTKLTITYTGFVGEKWPSDLRSIQKNISGW